MTIRKINRPWLKHYREDVPVELPPIKYQNLGELVLEMEEKYGENPAFSNFRRHLSFAEIGKRARAFAAVLQNMGYQPGDRLALMMPNILQYPICLYGCFLAGVIIVNINPLYTARELKFQLQDSGARGIVIAENFIEPLAKICADLPELKEVIITRYGDEMGWFWSPIVDFYVKKIAKLTPNYHLPIKPLFFKTLLREGQELPLDIPKIILDDVALLQYTGGTTGRAKGAMLTHRNILTNAQQIDLWIGKESVGVGDILITALPLYHIFCCTVNCVCFPAHGMHSVLITNPRDMKDFVSILKKYPFSIMTGVNTLFKGLLNTPGFTELDFSKLRFVVGGGMQLEKKVSDQWRETTGNVIIEGYGMTETSPLLTVNQLYSPKYTGNIGLPVPGTDIILCDEKENPVPIGEPGEMWVKGAQVMKGYWNQPEENKAVFSPDGWLKTGDIAVMDKQGSLRLVDRKKDMIVISGFNVYPSEIENTLTQHPAVLEAACIGIPDKERGEIIKAFIVLSPKQQVSEAELRIYAAENLTGYKRPKQYEFVKVLPKSAVGKILKRKLQ